MSIEIPPRPYFSMTWSTGSEIKVPADPIAVFPDTPTPLVEDLDELNDKLEKENEDGKGSKTSS